MLMTRYGHEMTAHQRAGLITFWLMQGSRLRTVDVARLAGITWPPAYRMMNALSAMLPIVQVDGYWQWIDESTHEVDRVC